MKKRSLLACATGAMMKRQLSAGLTTCRIFRADSIAPASFLNLSQGEKQRLAIAAVLALETALYHL